MFFLAFYRDYWRICENKYSSRMSNDVFDAHILGEKLSKLNNSQQSIECILYF